MTVKDVEVDGSNPKGGIISVWTLNRPDKLNALNTESHKAIKNECARANSDDNVRCIVIKGSPLKPREGKSPSHIHSLRADISEFAGKDSDDVRPFFEDNAWEAVWNVSKPTIAMVDGFALGGGQNWLYHAISDWLQRDRHSASLRSTSASFLEEAGLRGYADW